MSLKTFLQKIWKFIERVFAQLTVESRTIVRAANAVVEKIKTFVDAPGIDVITALTPFPDEKIVAGLRAFLPRVLAALTALQADDFTSENEMMKAAIVQINASGDEAKKIFYHGLGALLTELLSDGDFSWSDAVAVQEYFHKHEAKATPLL